MLYICIVSAQQQLNRANKLLKQDKTVSVTDKFFSLSILIYKIPKWR